MGNIGVSKDKHPASNPAVWHRVSLPTPSISILRGISAYPLAHPTEVIRLCFACPSFFFFFCSDLSVCFKVERAEQ